MQIPTECREEFASAFSLDSKELRFSVHNLGCLTGNDSMALMSAFQRCGTERRLCGWLAQRQVKALVYLEMLENTASGGWYRLTEHGIVCAERLLWVEAWIRANESNESNESN